MQDEHDMGAVKDSVDAVEGDISAVRDGVRAVKEGMHLYKASLTVLCKKSSEYIHTSAAPNLMKTCCVIGAFYCFVREARKHVVAGFASPVAHELQYV